MVIDVHVVADTDADATSPNHRIGLQMRAARFGNPDFENDACSARVTIFCRYFVAPQTPRKCMRAQILISVGFLSANVRSHVRGTCGA